MTCGKNKRHNYKGVGGICTTCGFTQKQVASKNTMEWIKNNPCRVKINRSRQKAYKEEELKLSLKALKKSKYKSPDSAIKAYCRGMCKYPGMAQEITRLNSGIYCTKKDCPLYPFRYGNPHRILISKKINNINKTINKGAAK